MPYVAIGRIAKALESLPRFHAFFGVTFLSMKKSGISKGEPIVWGSKQEQELIDEFYTPPGAPPGKPFFIPYGRPDKDSGHWKNPKYSGGTLQRARTTDNFRPALNHPSRDQWGFSPDYLDVLASQLAKDDKGQPIRIPLFDLAAWMLRDRELPVSLDGIVKLFRDEFQLHDNQEFETLFDANTALESASQFMYDSLPDRAELIELLEGVPEGPSLTGRTEEDLIQGVEEFIEKEALLSLPGGFVRNFYYSLKTQKFIVLAGRPGTGKTAFARAFAAALDKQFPGSVTEIIVSVGQEFGESDVIGYEKIAGGIAPTELTRALFLSGRQHDLFIVVLDEMNLAHVDYYLARLLPAIESDAPVELPGTEIRYELPPDAFFIGTVNSFIEEPTRVALSGPVKRRANVVAMPNTLELLLHAGDKTHFRDTVFGLLQQVRRRRYQRQQQGLSSVFDTFRVQDLDRALEEESEVLHEKFLAVLWEVCSICAADPQTSLTLGVLQDVVEYVALAHQERPLDALDRQMAQKIVPQLSGPAEVVRKLLEFVETLRNEELPLEHARRALEHLLETEDPSSGLVYYRY